MFDFTISLGNLLTVAAFIIGGITFIWTVKTDVAIIKSDMKSLAMIVELRVSSMDKQIRAIEDDIKKISEVMLTVAKQDGRLNVIDTRLQQQGDRLDELTNRFNAFADRTGPIAPKL